MNNKTSKTSSKTTKSAAKTTAKPRKTAVKPRKTSAKLPKTAAKLPPIDAQELPENPHTRWRPEYLGNPFVLSNNIPDYMPRAEADMVDWMKSYLDTAGQLSPTFPGVFGNSAPFPVISLVPL